MLYSDLSPILYIQGSPIWCYMSDSRDICILTPWPHFSVSWRKPGIKRCTPVNLSGLPSASCTSSCCLTQIERETLPEFVVANMLISVSSIDNTHPATWQRVTAVSNALAPPLTESYVCSGVCRTHVYVCVHARACLPHMQCLCICLREHNCEWPGR